jgi:hypothetical protein
MKITIHKWKNRDDTYSTSNITGTFNGQEPLSVEDVELEDKDAKELFKNPTKWKVKKEKNKGKLIKK